MTLNAESKRFLLTIDGDWIPGSGPGLEALLRVCDEYQVPSTIFVAGQFADAYPGLVSEASHTGHEIGAHGWAHSLDMEENFYSTSYEQQREWLLRATESIEKATSARPLVFRAPFLQVSATMLRVLEETGYRIDSSVPVRRFDAGFGMVNSLGYFRAPLEPYHPHPQSLGRRGVSPIIEVPPSSFVFPVSLTAVRLLGPFLTLWAARRVLNRVNVLSFYCHPWEFVSPDHQEFPQTFAKRHLRRIGVHNVEVLRSLLDKILGWGCKPATITQVVEPETLI